MTDFLSDPFDFLVFCVGLVVIAWVGLHASRRKRGRGWPAGAVIGMLVWLAALGLPSTWSSADVPRAPRRLIASVTGRGNLPHLGWEPYAVQAYQSWCGHTPEIIPFPRPDGSVLLIPVIGEAS